MGLEKNTNRRLAKSDTVVEVRDYSLWIKHIRGNTRLVAILQALHAGELIHLIVGGYKGVWQKKEDGSNGLPTPGLKPLGEMRERWFRWFKERRGEMVKIELDEVSNVGVNARRTIARIPLEPAAPEAERKAAWAALEALSDAGWRSEGPYGPREELYDR